MSGQRLLLVRIVPFMLMLVAVELPAAAVEVDANQLARCKALTAIDQRVACYDALASAVLAGASVPGPSGTAVRQPAVAQASAAPQTTPSTGSPNPVDPANFGLTNRQLKAPEGPESEKAVVSQITEDRLNNVYLVLDNGQTWGFIEPDPRIRPGDTVTIKRASLGSFLMVTPSRRSYRVQRVN